MLPKVFRTYVWSWRLDERSARGVGFRVEQAHRDRLRQTFDVCSTCIRVNGAWRPACRFRGEAGLGPIPQNRPPARQLDQEAATKPEMPRRGRRSFEEVRRLGRHSVEGMVFLRCDGETGAGMITAVVVVRQIDMRRKDENPKAGF